MSDKTPRTDAIIPSQSFVDETRLFDRCYFIPLLDLARQLERENSEAQRDAERYRWLRDNILSGNHGVLFSQAMNWKPAALQPAEVDEAIDAAIREAKETR